jgi:hypothetical protein
MAAVPKPHPLPNLPKTGLIIILAASQKGHLNACQFAEWLAKLVATDLNK